MVNVTAYYDSGYTPQNIPFLNFGLGIPEDIERRDFAAIDVVQVLFLNEISVKAKEDELAGIDFLILEDDSGDLFSGPVYYFVNPGYVMTSRDVAKLSITMSGYLTITAQGDGFDVLDGMITRDSTIPFETVMEDPLLFYRDAPERSVGSAFGAYPVEVGDQGIGSPPYYDPADADYRPITGGTAPFRRNWGGSKEGNNIFVTVYDSELGDVEAATAPVEITQTDGKFTYSPNFNTAPLMLGKVYVSPPKIIMDDGKYEGSEASYSYPAATFYTYPSNIIESARVLYAMGIANPISISYHLPKGFASIKLGGRTGQITELKGTALSYVINQDSRTLIKGVDGLLPQVYDDVANSLVSYVLTAVGTGQQSNITRRYMADPNKLIIDMVVDPSPNGAPYYKIRDKQQVGAQGAQFGPTSFAAGPEFQFQTMNGAVKGATWRPCPIVFANLGYKARESEYNARYALTQTSSANNLNQQEQQIQSGFYRGAVNAGMSMIGGGVNTGASAMYGLNNPEGDRIMNGGALGTIGGNLSFNPLAVLSNTIGSIWQLIDNDRNLRFSAAQALNGGAAQNDMFKRQNATNVYATQFAFTDGMMDMLGNGVLFETIYPSTADARNAIRIVQRYGFPCNNPATGGSFIILDQDADFRYVQTEGVQLAPSPGNRRKYPAMLFRMAENELNGGIRLWKIRPNESSYDNMYKEKEGS